MTRIIVTCLLALALSLASGPPARAQSDLKERSLNDTPAASHKPVPAAAPADPAPAPAAQPGAATVSPAPMPAQTPAAPAPTSVPGGGQQQQPAPPPAAHGGTPINGQPSGTPPPPPPPPPATGGQAYTPPPAGQGSMPPPPGGTPINGQTAVSPSPPPPPPPPSREQTYNRAEVNREVMGFFDSGSRGLAEMVARAFHDLGQPTGFIKGNEAGGALVVGLRYGSGTLYLKGQKPIPVYWQSPSLGIDLGVNAVRVFTLVYGTTHPNEIFQRFPGVDGSAYVLGGFGMNYQRSDNITLAPIRFGVGLRLGANVGYQHYTRTQDINPF